MIATESIIAALADAWNGSSGLTTLVPGKIWFGHAPQSPTTGEGDTPQAEPATESAYAILECEPDGEPEQTASRRFLAKYTITARVYSSLGMGDAARVSILTAIEAAWTIPGATVNLPAGSKFLHLLPSPGPVTMDPIRKNSKDVLAASSKWRALVSGSF